MTTLSDKLTAILAAKAEIKTALESRGIDMTDVAFNEYYAKILDLYGTDVNAELWTPADITTSLWLDASDTDTITKDGSNNISQWRDKSGNDRHANSNAAPIHYYDSTLGKWVVRFVSNDYMTIANVADIISNSTGFSFAIVLRRTTNKAANYYVGYTSGTSRLALGWGGTITIFNVNASYGGTDQFAAMQVETFFDGQIAIASGSYNVADDAFKSYWTGEERKESNSLSTPTTLDGMWIGREDASYAVGDMMEFIIIPDSSNSARQKLEGYLSNKWGKALLRHPYGAWAPRVTTIGDEWTPAEISTSVWFDANDTDSITKDGSNLISQWSDKSGNDRHATSGNAPLHYYDETLGKWVVRFDGSNDYLNYDGSFFINSDWSIIAAFRRRSTASNMLILAGSGTSNGTNMTFGANTHPNLGNNVWGSGVSNTWFSYDANEKILMSSINESLDANLFINGIFANNATLLALTSYPNPYIGRSVSLYSNLDVMEIIAINSAVSTETRQKIEGYLAHKWGITLSAHPYANYSPKVST